MTDIVERLNDIWRDDDHERGCEGRNYTCTCGFDERTLATAKEAAAEIRLLRGAMKADDERLRTAANRVGIHADCDAPDMMADEIERLRAALATKEAETLERAAKVADAAEISNGNPHTSYVQGRRDISAAIAAAIRALKEAKP